MQIVDYLKILRDNWIVLVLLTLIGGGLATASAVSKPLEYDATATLSVSACVMVEYSTSCDHIRGTQFAVERAKIYTSLATTSPVLNDALLRADSTRTRTELRGMVTATIVAPTQVLEITVRSADPDETVVLATALSEALINYSGAAVEITSEEPTSSATIELVVVSPPSQVIKDKSSGILLGSVLGLVAGMVIGLARFALNSRLRSVSEAETISRLQVLGSVPTELSSSAQSLSVSKADSDDSFRRLAAAVLQKTEKKNSNSLLVTSSQMDEHAQAVATGLAVAIAESGARVAIVDADPRNSSLAAAFNLSGDAGFLDVVQSKQDGLFHRIGTSSLFVLPWGKGTPGHEYPLSREKLRAAFTTLKQDFDFIVILAPPMISTADTVALLPHVDEVLLVAGLGVVTRNQLRQVLEELALLDKRPIGLTITNGRKDHPLRTTGWGHARISSDEGQ